jgi:hypothetical protein
MGRICFLALFILFIVECIPNNVHSSIPNLEQLNKAEQASKDDTLKIDCDSIYWNKGYRLTFTRFDFSDDEDETRPNTVFTFSKLSKEGNHILYSDSIFNQIQEFQFEDYDGDGVKDILIQNYSDVRSNRSYNLYLVDTARNKLKKIRGFENIKNPHYLAGDNLIDNYVMSGEIWTSFYKIQGDTVKDFQIVVYDNQLNDGSYERDYKKALKQILKKESDGRQSR